MNIEIRNSTQADIPAIRDLYAQRSCYAETLQLPYPTIEKWERFLGNMPENFHSLVAIRDGAVVGQIGMEVFTGARRKHVANIGMGVSEAHQNSGVGSALMAAIIDLASNWLAIKRIELEVYTDNASAIALYEKFGFQQEGTGKQYAFRNGQYTDVNFMAKLLDD